MITPPRQPGAVIAKAMLAAAVDQAPQQASPEELAALERLLGAIVFFLQIDTLTHKNSSRDKHLQNRLSETPCAFGAD